MSQTKYFRERLRTAYSNMDFHGFCRRAGFLPNDYAKGKWAEWQTLSNVFAAFDDETLEKILGEPTFQPVFIIVRDLGPQRDFEFVDIQNKVGERLSPLHAFECLPGDPPLIKIGPFLASVREPGLQPVSGTLTKPDQSARKDGPPEDPGPDAPGPVALERAKDIVAGCSNWSDIQYKIIPKIARLLERLSKYEYEHE